MDYISVKEAADVYKRQVRAEQIQVKPYVQRKGHKHNANANSDQNICHRFRYTREQDKARHNQIQNHGVEPVSYTHLEWLVLKPWDIAFISKGENFKIPFFGRIIRKCCFMPIDRENPRKALRTINKA